MIKKGDKTSFNNEDLVLDVSSNVDPEKWNESKYEAFLDELCGVREYQKEAIYTTLRYLLSGNYKDLRQLAKGCFDDNDEIQQRNGSWKSFESHLQMPSRLSCSLDLATGTGKSYVLYGLAVILLAEGIVDRVLVLCPSNTIEAGLTEKFRDLAGKRDLRDLLPAESKFKAPKVINADETIVNGSICVENYHAILGHVKSSITDSLKEGGERVAVFNDEAHHVANRKGAQSKKWKDFLQSKDYKFKYVVGVSGTCYVGNDYFSDVIYRYSLRSAIEQQFVKQIEYITELPTTGNVEEKWQLIYKQHEKWKKDLKKRKIKPLSIIITKDISRCKDTAEELQAFIKEWEGISAADAKRKVLVVTSSKEHQANLAKLKSVDSSASKVEWIVSVSMLTEGWDVKNVFQIVPHEERAFNSKLLIAQVLGRGLRRPENWKGEPPVVSVFNHDAWSSRIKHLVNEVLEIERRLSSSVVKDSNFDFVLHNLDYDRSEDTSTYTKKGQYKFLESGYVDLPTQVDAEDVAIEYERATTGQSTTFNTKLEHKTYSSIEVADRMYKALQAIDQESKSSKDPKDRTSYTKKFTRKKCKEIVEASLKRAKIRTGRVTEENRQKFLQALGTLRRKKAKRVVYKLNANALVELRASSRPGESCSAAELRRGDKTVFFPPVCRENIVDEQKEFFDEVSDPDGEYRAGCESIANDHDFKTCLNFVLADATPERKFVRSLCKRENANAIDTWLKNTNQRFYWIEYAWKKGEHPKRGEFSPDFFIKIGNKIYVIEIKDDSEIRDPAIENQKKYQYSIQHFAELNDWLKKRKKRARYQFNFVSPKDFNKFFQLLRDGDLGGFQSQLDVALRKSTESK